MTLDEAISILQRDKNLLSVPNDEVEPESTATETEAADGNHESATTDSTGLKPAELAEASRLWTSIDIIKSKILALGRGKKMFMIRKKHTDANT